MRLYSCQGKSWIRSLSSESCSRQTFNTHHLCVCMDGCSCGLCPAGGAAEPLSLWWLRALHAPVLPYPLDQWKRLLELRALLLQVPGPGHQHQKPTAGTAAMLCNGATRVIQSDKRQKSTHKHYQRGKRIMLRMKPLYFKHGNSHLLFCRRQIKLPISVS